MSAQTSNASGPFPLTDEQRAIVQAPDGPIVVLAGAGTGKTRVVVERVRWLLETRGAKSAKGDYIPAEPQPRHANPFDGPLVPEQILVLTYNVKAAAELMNRLDTTPGVGAAVRARMTVQNFHGFCHHVLTESATDAGLPSMPDVLDGPGQILLLRDIRPTLELLYHNDYDNTYASWVSFISRCKDELVAPEALDQFVQKEVEEWQRRYGNYAAAIERLDAAGNLAPLRAVQRLYAKVRAGERAEDLGREAKPYNSDAHIKEAEKEARRVFSPTGTAHKQLKSYSPEERAGILELAATYERDGAALEVLRLQEIADVYRGYQQELVRRGALDFGEQIALVIRLFRTRPNVLRRWQRQYRYILVDEFQDANVAQIQLIELIGRTPDRPDNVMVVGDDDQSIYRFRGASYAAFVEFDRRFGSPPAHNPDSASPGQPRRYRIEQNFRSVANVLMVANRLIENNTTRYAPDKHLTTDKANGAAVELHVRANPEDQAVAIVDAIKSMAGQDAPDNGTGKRWTWSDVAVLYRKHAHREAIVARLREEDIPYTVSGGLSLFETAEIRDLEQGLRAIANPLDDTALVRMMTAGPWRLDAIEILHVTRDANFDRSHVIDAIGRIVATGVINEDIADSDEKPEKTRKQGIGAETRAKLRLLLQAIDELNPLTWREGPYTVLERYLERTAVILDLLAAGTLEAKRSVVNIASFMRFVADWQAEGGSRTLAGFVAYLDAFKSANGELPTSVELNEDVEGVRLMTLYQAKGLEFPVVIVPHLLEGEWPIRPQGNGWFPVELLTEQVPEGDVHNDEERRLLYVAVTRAKHRLLLMTFHDPKKARSRFLDEMLEDMGAELTVFDDTQTADAAGAADYDAEPDDAEADTDEDEAEPGLAKALAAARKVMPLPTARERRLAMRLRASELVGMLEAADPAYPETPAARERLAARLAEVGTSAALDADQVRAAGLDPLTFRTVALDTGSGANLLKVAPLPPTFSYTSLSAYEECGLRYSFKYVYRIPSPDRPRAAASFGSTAHAAFETFTKERRERLARGEEAPNREDLERLFKANWKPTEFGDQTTEARFAKKITNLLDNFYTGEIESRATVLHEELKFTLVLDPGDGSAPVRIGGSIDRIDRLESGGIEVLDYKTGKVESQKDVDTNLQLTIYALVVRDTLRLGTPEKVTLYFTETSDRRSTVRTDEQLDLARQELLDRVRPIRAGEFTANPGDACKWCDYTAICSERKLKRW